MAVLLRAANGNTTRTSSIKNGQRGTSRKLWNLTNLHRWLALCLAVWLILATRLHGKVFRLGRSFWEATPRAIQDFALPYNQYLPRRKGKHPVTPLSSDHTTGKPLNIVLLYADDLRWDSLGVQGNPWVQTPFLDQLANERGIRFEQNRVVTSICWMSRATLHTGLYTSRHKGWVPDQPFWYRHWYESFPYLMKKVQNYTMAHVGKWDYKFFHDVTPVHETYEYSRLYHGAHWYSPEEINKDVYEQTQATGQAQYDTKYKSHSVGEEERIHITDRTVADAVEFLEHRPRDKPFMLTVAFFPPHSVDGTEAQFFPQPETAAAYSTYPNNQTILPPVPPDFSVQNMNESFARLPKSIFYDGVGNEARTRWHLRFDHVAKYNMMMRRYYQMVTGVDSACEKVVKELERQGILDETLVIFTSDNGFYHGEHGLAGKWFPHEESIRVPFIVVDPRAPPSARGSVREEMTLNTDLAPTILNAAQIRAPSQMQGRDVSELYRQYPVPNEKKEEPWREEFYYEYPQLFDSEIFLPACTALVRAAHKYIQWGSVRERRVEQLFDLRIDPKEESDVSGDPGYASLLNEMRKRHEELRLECCDDIGHINTPIGTPDTTKYPPKKDPIGERASKLQDWREATISR